MIPEIAALKIRRYATAIKISITARAITAVSFIAHAAKKISARKTAWRSAGSVSSSVTIAATSRSGAINDSRSYAW